jgi:hypothetical protein
MLLLWTRLQMMLTVQGRRLVSEDPDALAENNGLHQHAKGLNNNSSAALLR